MTTIFTADGDDLRPIPRKQLSNEDQLETWIAADARRLGMDLLIIGRQVETPYGGRIDLLALDRNGGVVVLELKRDRTPREIVAQVLDYGSWVQDLTPRAVEDIAIRHIGKPLDIAFQGYFGLTLPETLNASHRLLIVASEFDPASRRIVEYLSSAYGVDINTFFFSVFNLNGQSLLATEWLIDQDAVTEKARSRREATWSGYWYVNAGDEPKVRSWEDMRQYGFIAAGGGRWYSRALKRLRVGNELFAYQRPKGYIGYGVVTSEPTPVSEFQISTGRPLLSLPLAEAGIAHDSGNPDLEEWAVSVDWKKTLAISDAKTFPGVFANQNIVCKLTDVETIEFLKNIFLPT